MLDIPWIVSAILFLFFTIFLIKWNFFNPKTQKNSPPSPPTFPILGNLHQIGSYPHRSLQKLSHQYGPLMQLHFGSRPVLLVSSSDAAREVMKTHDLIVSYRPQFSVAHRLLYHEKDITTAPYGEYWRQLRSICALHLLSNKRVQSFRSVREEEVGLLVENIKRQCYSQSLPVNLSDMLALLTNDVICRVALGKKYSRDENGKRFKELISELMKLLGGFYIGDCIPWLAWIHRVNGLDKEVDKVAQEFDKFLDVVVEEHKKKFDTKGFELNEDRMDLVDVLLQIQRDDKMPGLSIDRESIKAVILNMFVGGTDTTYTVLEWAMSELLRNPRVLNKLQNELMEISNGKPGINEDDIEKMHYLKAVIKETLRLYPPVPLLVPRKSAQDININGYDIAAGTMVITNAWTLGRDPKLWEEAEVFKPERFLDSSIDFKGQDFQFIPFGAGRRGCPGTLFGMAIDEVALANLVHKFNWKLPDGVKAQDLDMTECIGATIHREVPLLAVPTPRF